jgi:MFS family permease
VVAVLMGLGVAAIGWHASVVLYGAIVAAAGIYTFLALAGRQGTNASKVCRGFALSWTDWGFTDPTGFALLATIHLVDSACRTAFLTFAPFLLIAKGASVTSIGFALGLVFIGGAAGKLVCGLIAERFGILRTVILTELATGVLIAAVVASPLLLTAILLIPLGVALNGTSSVLYGTVAEFVREDRQSRSFGLFYAIGSVASATAPVIFGIIGDLTGVAAALLLVALLALLTLPIAFVLQPHIARHVSGLRQ